MNQEGPKFTVEEEGKIGEHYYYAILMNHSFGTYTGYLAVPPDHPWYGQDRNDIEVSVHGGLTYEAASQYGHPMEIAQLEKEIADIQTWNFEATETMLKWKQRSLDREKEQAGQWQDYPVALHVDVWWFGFDCAHGDDITPKMDVLMESLGHPIQHFPGQTFKDRDYVFNEINSMVSQATVAMQIHQIINTQVKEHNAQES